jgi:hypothetical protein
MKNEKCDMENVPAPARGTRAFATLPFGTQREPLAVSCLVSAWRLTITSVMSSAA